MLSANSVKLHAGIRTVIGIVRLLPCLEKASNHSPVVRMPLQQGSNWLLHTPHLDAEESRATLWRRRKERELREVHVNRLSRTNRPLIGGARLCFVAESPSYARIRLVVRSFLGACAIATFHNSPRAPVPSSSSLYCFELTTLKQIEQTELFCSDMKLPPRG